MGLLLVTRFTLLEALLRRLFLAVVILSALMLAVFAILLSVGMHFLVANNNSDLSPQLFLLSGGIFIAVMVGWMVYLLSSLLTIVLTAGMISGEVEAGTFAVIVPKPLSRAEIVLGKWLGYALILGVYTAVLFLSFLAVIYWQSGYWPPQVLRALGILELETMTLLAITTLGSSLVPTIVNGAIALILFIGAPISSVVQFIVQAISQAQDQAMQNIAITISLVVPTDALWHGTSFYLLPSQNLFAILGVSTRSFNTPFTSAEPLTAAFLVWAVLYSLILPLLAVLRFQRRDL
ncbi:MAG: ABC transporter permease subunit [Chloroflexi bacterium]|nr:ABC transporter permease subunit [Chloroflexota bacterium]